MAYSPQHLNGHLLAAVDTETTGLNPFRHDMLQLCILPLGPDLKPSKEFKFLELKIRPERVHHADPQAGRVNKGLLQQCQTYGIERWAAVELVLEWFKKLKLPMNKKIVPVGANYVHDRDFIREFMGGPESYAEIFRDDFRDVQKMALTVNDMCDWHSEAVPFPKTFLVYLASCLGIERVKAHDAIGDCLATAEIYRRMMRYKEFWTPVPIPENEIDSRLIDSFIRDFDSAPDRTIFLKRFLGRTGRTLVSPESTSPADPIQHTHSS